MDRVFLLTPTLVVAYDCYPKAQRHLLIMPRSRLGGPADLRPEHAPLLRSMVQMGCAIARAFRRDQPEIAPLRLGFNAAPSMRQLHLHAISADLDSACLKSKKHWNSFTTDFFVRPSTWTRMLERDGYVALDRAAEEMKLKAPMVCPYTGTHIANVPKLKAHVVGEAFRAGAMADDGDATT